MKKILYLAIAATLLTGCWEDWEEPAAPKLSTDEELVNDGYTLMSINDFKQAYFYNETPAPAAAVKAVTIPADDQSSKVYLKGKVISSDELGNIYRSLYIQDATGWQGGAIELKLGTSSLYNVYKPGQIVYVKTDGLVLGNYRWMLSLGAPSVDAKYSNGYIDIEGKINQKILRGEIAGLTAADTLVINSSNVATYCGADDRKYLGCLVRFEGLKSVFGTVSGNESFSDTDIFPSYMWSYTFPGDKKASTLTFEYKNPHYNKEKNADGAYKAYPNTWAYSYECFDDYTVTMTSYSEHPLAEVHFLDWTGLSLGGVLGSYENYYGSMLFLYTDAYPFIVRTSAYAKFALKDDVPANGDTVDMTAILTKYCSSGGGFMKYQLVLNSDKDVKVVQ